MNKKRTSREGLWVHGRQTYNASMSDILDELREILGPIVEMPAMSDADAVRFIQELKSMPDPTPQRLEWIRALEDAWHRAAAPDMARR